MSSERVRYIFLLWIVVLAHHFCTGYNYNTNPKYFDNNKLKCNCEGFRACQQGKCSPDRCEPPFVGITCQHASVDMVLQSVSYTHNSLRDGNDGTCAPGSFQGNIVYHLKKVVHFVWVYVYRSKGQKMAPVLKLFKSNTAVSVKTFIHKISDHAVLVKSHDDLLYDRLELSALPTDTCSVEISIGRNVAMKAKTNANHVHSSKFKTQCATDGDEANTWRGHCCFYSGHKFNSGQAWLKILLAHPARINLVLLLNAYTSQCRLSGFDLETFTASGSRILNYRDKTNSYQDEFTIDVASKDLIQEITVTANSACTRNELQVCEARVFGEFVCPANMYGALCAIKCPSACSRDTCDPDWGCRECKGKWRGLFCQKDCRLKWGLPNCNKDCSKTCATKINVGRGECNIKNGHCLYGCVPGYNKSTSPTCSTICPYPYFGLNCSEECNNCLFNKSVRARRCHHVTGKCLDGCAQGFQGETCVEAGKFFVYMAVAFGLVFSCVVGSIVNQIRHSNARGIF